MPRGEMMEEIGLDVPLVHISTFLPENARRNHYWAIYEATAPAGWKFTETEEVKSLEQMKLPDIVAMMDDDPEKFTHGFANAVKEFSRQKGMYG